MCVEWIGDGVNVGATTAEIERSEKVCDSGRDPRHPRGAQDLVPPVGRHVQGVSLANQTMQRPVRQGIVLVQDNANRGRRTLNLV